MAQGSASRRSSVRASVQASVQAPVRESWVHRAREVCARVMRDAAVALETHVVDRYYSDPSPSERDARARGETTERMACKALFVRLNLKAHRESFRFADAI